MKKFLPSLFFLILFCPAAHAIVLFGYDFDDTAFVDNATYVSGQIDYWGFSKWGYPITGDDNVDLDTALNGPDLYTLIEGKRINGVYYNYTVEVEFIDNYLFNGAGYDLLVFERGSSAERFDVSLFNPSQNQWTAPIEFSGSFVGTVPDTVDIADSVNLAKIDFSLWGLPNDVPIQKLLISTERWTGAERESADLAAFGGLNSRPVAIPEPSTIFLLGTGLFGLLFRRKSFRY